MTECGSCLKTTHARYYGFHLDNAKSHLIYVYKKRERWPCYTWCAFKQLLKMENCLLLVLLSKHNVCQHLRTNIFKKQVVIYGSENGYGQNCSGKRSEQTRVASSLNWSFFKMMLHCSWHASVSPKVRYKHANSSIT